MFVAKALAGLPPTPFMLAIAPAIAALAGNLGKSLIMKIGAPKLAESIQGEVKEFPNSIGIYFDMEAYGNFQDKGVSGKFKKYNTEYSYKSKMPPPSKLDKWIVRKGIAPRNVAGKFQSRKGLQFAIAKSIFKYGIKPR